MMEVFKNILYARIVPKSLVIVDFEYSHTSTNIFQYSFIRPLEEKLDVFIKRIKTKLTKAKYSKSFKKIPKNSNGTIESCEINVIMDGITPKSLKSLTLEDLLSGLLSLKINDRVYSVINASVWILNAQLPNVNMSNCPIIPKLDLSKGSIADVSVRWSVNKECISSDWTFVQLSHVFVPTEDHIGLFVRAEVSTSVDLKSQKFIIVSKLRIEILPQSDYQLCLAMERMRLKNDIVRVCSYNILSNSYADTKDARDRIYRHCDPSFLALPYRQCLLIHELSTFNSDIYLLQECDASLYDEVLQPLMTSLSLAGIHQSKSGRVSEGGAILWRQDLFSFVRNISVENLSTSLNNNLSEVCERMKAHIMKDDRLWRRWQSLSHCMTGCVLKYDRLPREMFLIVANNHLFYHPQYELLRLYQIVLVIIEIENIKADYPQSVVVIGGDFNASYEDPTIRFVLDGIIKFDGLQLEHQLVRLKSAFMDKIDFSNFTPDYVGILDHIFFDSRQIVIDRVHRLPTRSDIESNTALPNKYHPSDHLPLIADFVFK